MPKRYAHNGFWHFREVNTMNLWIVKNRPTATIGFLWGGLESFETSISSINNNSLLLVIFQNFDFLFMRDIHDGQQICHSLRLTQN